MAAGYHASRHAVITTIPVVALALVLLARARG
jgi:hypothetical protein